MPNATHLEKVDDCEARQNDVGGSAVTAQFLLTTQSVAAAAAAAVVVVCRWRNEAEDEEERGQIFKLRPRRPRTPAAVAAGAFTTANYPGRQEAEQAAAAVPRSPVIPTQPAPSWMRSWPVRGPLSHLDCPAHSLLARCLPAWLACLPAPGQQLYPTAAVPLKEPPPPFPVQQPSQLACLPHSFTRALTPKWKMATPTL